MVPNALRNINAFSLHFLQANIIAFSLPNIATKNNKCNGRGELF